jgi:hypothetical protein
MEYTHFSEAPDLFHFWAGVSTIAGALRRRVWIDQRYFQWTPNFYIIFVAPAGVISKSTTANIGMRLLRQIDGIYFGPNSLTWQALTQSLAEATELVEIIPGDFYPMSCLTISSSELGSLLNPQDREFVDVLVDLWDSQIGVWKRTTKTQGDDTIENPWLNIIGCTTPAWIRENVPEYVIGGGFASRCVFVYGDRKRRLVAYPGQDSKNVKLDILETDLINDLRIIAELKGEYRLTAEAQQWGVAWYEKHWNERPIHLASERFGGYIARKQTHMHKLAMVLAASESDNLSITAETLSLSAQFVSALEPEMVKIFQHIGMTEQTRSIQELINTVHSHQRIERRELFRILHRQLTYDEFERSLASAINGGFVIQLQTKEGIFLTIGRTSEDKKVEQQT